MTAEGEKARRHLRYRPDDLQVLHLVREGDAERKDLSALLIDESHQGFSCVLVGPSPTPGDRFFHQENEKIRTPLILRNQRQLEEGIHVLGFERTNEVIRTEG